MRDRGSAQFHREARQPPQLPRGYLQNGYFDSNGNLWPEVIVQWPDEIARTFRDTREFTATQLRRFFAQARAVERTLGSKPFDRLKEDILGLKVFAAASVGRKSAPEIFKAFMDKNVDLAVRSPEDFKRGFLTHFQSVIAYLKYYEEKGKRR